MTITTGSPLVRRLETNRTRSQSFWARALRSLSHDPMTMAAIFVLAALTVICIVGPTILENNFSLYANDTNVLEKYMVPGEGNHLLGTDNLGRDQFARLLVGGQISLSIAYFASLLSIAIGVTLGVSVGFYGGAIDDIFIWFIATLTSIPPIFLLLIAASLWSPSPPVLIAILALLSWVDVARLVRGEVFSLRESDFVMAARSIGASPRRIMISHLLPNLLPVVIVSLAIDAGVLILVESGLSFLGLGVQPPTPSWGNMLTDARTYFAKGPHLVFWPGLLISTAVVCFYLVGDGLRDALDPRFTRK
jgi:peptide/nickel transport system permease protein